MPVSANVPLGERVTGRVLARSWRVNVRHALYHKGGTWYNKLERFPGALFDPGGYIIFRTRDEYERNPFLKRGKELKCAAWHFIDPGVCPCSAKLRVGG
jgi:hypothetical protein